MVHAGLRTPTMFLASLLRAETYTATPILSPSSGDSQAPLIHLSRLQSIFKGARVQRAVLEARIPCGCRGSVRRAQIMLL